MLHGMKLRFSSGNFGEEFSNHLGPAVVLVALAVHVLFRSRLVVQLAAAMAILVALLAMGPTLRVGGHVTSVPLPGRLLEDKPFFSSIVPPRLAPYIYLMVAVLLGVFVGAFMSVRNWKLRVGGLLATAAALLPLLPALPYPA